jgi:DNA-binding HxlR family transcriptional regulator
MFHPRKIERNLQAFLDCLQKCRRIDILLVLYELGDDAGWTQTRKLLEVKGTPVSDGTFRDACKELVALGLADVILIDRYKRKYRLTDYGCLLASVVDAMVRDVGILCKEIEVGIKAHH